MDRRSILMNQVEINRQAVALLAYLADRMEKEADRIPVVVESSEPATTTTTENPSCPAARANANASKILTVAAITTCNMLGCQGCPTCN